MPFDTFFNLPKDKQDRVMDSAIQEFSEKGYQKASIQSIVDRAAISKGSMYQYFKDKKELYVYIYEQAVIAKLDMMNSLMDETKGKNFYEIMHLLLLAGIDFAKKHPREQKMFLSDQSNDFNNLPKEVKKAINGIIYIEGVKKYQIFMSELISNAKKDGSLRNDIDDQFVNFIVTFMLKAFTEYVVMINQSIDDTKDIRKIADKTIDIMKNGLNGKGNNFNLF